MSRRAFALVAVLVVMGGAILVATSLLFVAHAEIAGGSAAIEHVQTRALAWSGAQAVMVRLDEQRDVILRGDTPALDEQYVLYEAGERLGVVRLLSLGSDGERLVPEAGKLDLAAAGAEALVETGLVDEAAAGSIARYRDTDPGTPFQSVGELLRVPDLAAETVYGPVEELGAADDGIEDGSRGLADAVTVWSFEPALQMSGRLRINLNAEWSDELGRRVSRRFGGDAAETLQRIFESGTTFDTEAKIFQVLRFFQVEPKDWPEIVDTFTTESGEYHFGRLDINTAPYEALLALPGIDAEQAAAIVQARDDLSGDERPTVAWLAMRGIVEPEAYDDLAGLITTRSWTYRVRLACGAVDADDPEAPLDGAAIYEAVIDLSSPRPRLAYWRDVTHLRTAALIAANVSPDEDDEDVVGEVDEPADEPGEPDPGPIEQPPPGVPVDAGEGGAAASPPATPAAGGPTRKRIGRWTSGDPPAADPPGP